MWSWTKRSSKVASQKKYSSSIGMQGYQIERRLRHNGLERRLLLQAEQAEDDVVDGARHVVLEQPGQLLALLLVATATHPSGDGLALENNSQVTSSLCICQGVDSLDLTR